MKLGLIVAMEEELKIVLDNMDINEKTEYAGMIFYDGIYKGVKTIAVICGIGKVNSAICTQILISTFEVDKVINIGVAGGIGELEPGDVVIANSLVQHDVDASGFNYDLGRIPRLDTFDFKPDRELLEIARKACKKIDNHKIYEGRIVTGDQFINSSEKANWLKRYFGAIACEMEGASIAQVAYLNKIPFIVIRSISDNADKKASISFDEFINIAAENATIILENLLKEISKIEEDK
ncbi:MAG: 5'-methylthioadenosine/adenosylhomocysteine nucleosidase [Andreesenia angusta]|nr:5'-methylthioadenosine/adenosylhomocysteine nucleosidase [Andreesenia angusta]